MIETFKPEMHDVVWVLVRHSDGDREPGIVTDIRFIEGLPTVAQVLVNNLCLMSVPDDAEVLGKVEMRELAKLLGIDRG